MRNIFTSTNSAIATGQIHTAHIVEVTLADTSNLDYKIYMTDYHKDVSYGGNTYLATGHLLDITDLTTTSDLQINDITITLSGIDATKIAEVLSYNYIDRPLIISRVFFSDNDNIINVPYPIFAGRINNPSIVDDPNSGTSVVSINASSYLSDFDRKPNRHTNHIEHNFYYPNDDFFSMWGKINKEIIWGHKE
tara:strand:- start:6888 stop:7466 length:579 start_codon:yes stop_codon:yes gene_type:complete